MLSDIPCFNGFFRGSRSGGVGGGGNNVEVKKNTESIISNFTPLCWVWEKGKTYIPKCPQGITLSLRGNQQAEFVIRIRTRASGEGYILMRWKCKLQDVSNSYRSLIISPVNRSA